MSSDHEDAGGERHQDFIRPGREFSHYKIISCLGEGGMGEVYLAMDTSLNRNVAVKFMPLDYCSDPESQERFRNEAKAAAALNHSNIVTIHEVGSLEGRPYYVMEYVKGQSLLELIESGSLSHKRVLDIAFQVTEGLKEAHKAGIIHRDIKPSNIIVDTNGIAKILDFGISCVTANPRVNDQTTEGTVGYTAPEIIMGSDPSAASDLFSLGVTLYQALTGASPFRGDYIASVNYSIVNDPVSPIRELRPDVPENLEAIIMRLLEKEPGRRFSDATDLLAALEAISERDISDSRTRVAELGRRFLAPVVAMIVVAAVVIGLNVLRTGPKSPDSAEKIWIAVLPFENLGSPEDEYFTDGIADAITLHLAKLGNLAVISRSSSMRYKSTDLAVLDIGNALGVTHVVTGTVQWEKTGNSNRVRVNASLTRIRDTKLLWGNSYDLTLGSLFDLQSELAERITSALHIAISEEYKRELNRQPTYSMEAYNLYLKGNEYFNKSWGRQDIEIALDMYEKALAIDPEFASAHAMVSRGNASLFWDGFDTSRDRCRSAFEHARRSLEIDPELPEGFLALGYCYYHCDGHYDAATDLFYAALKKCPSNSDLYNAIAAIHRRKGDLDSSIIYFEKALELDPLSHLKALDVCLTFCMLRDYDSASVYLDKAIFLDPDLALPRVLRAWLCILDRGDIESARRVLAEASSKVNLSQCQYYWWISRILNDDYLELTRMPSPTTEKDTISYYLFLTQLHRLMGDTDNEFRYAEISKEILLRSYDSLSQDARIHSQLSLAYAGLRDRAEAFHHGEMAMLFLPASRDAFDAPFYMLNLAEVYTIFGEQDAAIDQLETLLTLPGFVTVQYLKLDPIWKPLKRNQRFNMILAISDTT